MWFRLCIRPDNVSRLLGSWVRKNVKLFISFYMKIYQGTCVSDLLINKYRPIKMKFIYLIQEIFSFSNWVYQTNALTFFYQLRVIE